MGGLLAIAIRTPGFLRSVTERSELLWVVFITLIAGAGVLNFVQSSQGGVIVHLWLGALYATLILIAFHFPHHTITRALENRALIWFGLRSYGIYLLHQPISAIIHRQWHGGQPHFTDWMGALPTVLALGITCVAAEISYRFFEQYWLRLGRRMTPDGVGLTIFASSGGRAPEIPLANTPNADGPPIMAGSVPDGPPTHSCASVRTDVSAGPRKE